jgi:hypothetical protein
VFQRNNRWSYTQQKPAKVEFRQAIRIYFTEIDGQIVLLLGGSRKRNQNREIAKARAIEGLQATKQVSKIMAVSRELNIKEQPYEDLKDPVYASAYINEAILDGDGRVDRRNLTSSPPQIRT